MESNSHDTQRVTVVDFDMKIGSLVILILKFALAAIPALIILFIASAMLAGMVSALGRAV